MSGRTPRPLAKKSTKRTQIIEDIVGALKGDDIFHTLDYRRKSEAYIKQYMHQPLKRRLVGVHRRLSPSVSEKTLRKKADRSIVWEGDKRTSIHHIHFLGTKHRPDFVVNIWSMKIAVEVKRGASGSAIREGIGQSLLYAASGDFDFVICLFVDTSKDKKIVQSLRRPADRRFVASLWHHHNVRFAVV